MIPIWQIFEFWNGFVLTTNYSTNFKKTTKKTPRKSTKLRRRLSSAMDGRSPKQADGSQNAWTDQPTQRGVAARSTDPAELTKDTQVLWGFGRDLVSSVFFWGGRFGRFCFPGKQTVFANLEAWDVLVFFCWNKMGLAIFLSESLMNIGITMTIREHLGW